jgi:hypothetical protein
VRKCLECDRFTGNVECTWCGSAETIPCEWVSTAVLWKPWTWGRGHWQFDYGGRGPTRWWRRFDIPAAPVTDA